MGGLDAHAHAYRNLLLDPCGAQLVPSCYSGSGSGNYLRLRKYINFAAGDTAGIYFFSLGTNQYWEFSATSGSSTISAATPFSSSSDIFSHPSLVGTVGERPNLRCIAGCVKVRYFGSESARAGVIATYTGPHLYGPGDYPTPAATPMEVMSAFPHLNRTGEVVHEVKFVPLSGDEQFDENGSTAHLDEKNVIGIGASGVPATTIQMEITAIYEYEASGSAASGVVVSTLPPPSFNTLNQVLRSLGPATNWAYSNVVAPVLRATASTAVGVIKSGVTAMSAQALRYATIL